MLFKILTNQEQTNSQLFWFIMGIGFIAIFVSITSFFPQALKTIKTKKTNSVSIITFSLYTLANILWFVWGILDLVVNGKNDLIVILKDLIVIIANIPCAIWAGIILGIKIYNMYQYGEDCKKWKGKRNITKKIVGSSNSFLDLNPNEIKTEIN